MRLLVGGSGVCRDWVCLSVHRMNYIVPDPLYAIVLSSRAPLPSSRSQLTHLSAQMVVSSYRGSS